jgi:hypothetical protein
MNCCRPELSVSRRQPDRASPPRRRLIAKFFGRSGFTQQEDRREHSLSNKFTPDTECLVSFSLMGPESGGLCRVGCNDGKITRIQPYDYDTEDTNARCHPGRWKPAAKLLSTPARHVTHFGLAYKTRVYSPNRILYR